MPIVKTDVPATAAGCSQAIREITQRYPFCRWERLGVTAFGRPIETLVIGDGPRRVLFTAAHHANEWITATVLLKFAEELAAVAENGTEIAGTDARVLLQQVTIHTVPMVDPDGVDLVTGAIMPGTPEYQQALEIAEEFPNIPFPDGWKANLLGVDLNLQYPAGWLRAREIKFSQGYTRPAPRDYVGKAPLLQVEARLLADYTARIDPELVLAYHSQGEVIYWQFDDIFVPGARELGQRLAQVSGYTLDETPPESAYAGYKDWFIKFFRRPGYTVEVGMGENPLPISQFPKIYQDNLPLLVEAARG